MQKNPEKLIRAVVEFEDRYFFFHFGVNPVAIAKAVTENITAGRVVRGGSTITQQVIRISRYPTPRTVWEKFIELHLAVALEILYSKQEILDLWLNNAPFGGNIVGLHAASLRLFGRQIPELTWAESALLAVLPNSPSDINTSRNREKLREKRNLLLNKLHRNGHLSEIDLQIALLEPIPEHPLPMPELAQHLLFQEQEILPKTSLAKSTTSQENIRTTFLDIHLQLNAQKVLQSHVKRLAENQIGNAAAIIVHVPTGQVRMYHGNVHADDDENAEYVDIIRAPRSSGSILKPFLYATMLAQGELFPEMLLNDLPIRYSGFFPKNFDHNFRGVVPANEALFRSLNVPFVNLLSRYGVPAFLLDTHNFGLGKTINQSAEHYGLSLILGGAETRLWDLARLYSAFAYKLAWFDETSSNQVYKLNLMQSESFEEETLQLSSLPDQASIWHTFENLTRLMRPEHEVYWQNFSSSRKVAWKTGTSFGHRDAWAIGVTPEWVVGVWTGNASGEGRAGLTGVLTSAPILFDLFQLLPQTTWFLEPTFQMNSTKMCVKSGYPASKLCPETKDVYVPKVDNNVGLCPFHIRIHTNKNQTFRLNADCATLPELNETSWFSLHPIQEWYFTKKSPDYSPIPPMHPKCEDNEERQKNLQIFYPDNNSEIYVPVTHIQKQEGILFEAFHRSNEATVYWHLDDEYIGQTQGFHQIKVHPSRGEHILTLVDSSGEIIARNFKILSKKQHF